MTLLRSFGCHIISVLRLFVRLSVEILTVRVFGR